MTPFQKAKQDAIALGIDVSKMKSLKEVEAVIAEFTAKNAAATSTAADTAVKSEKKPGRPIVEGCARQIRLAKMAEKAAKGELKRGRPANPDSERQKRIQEREIKKQNGETIKRGRPAKVKTDANVVIDVPAPNVPAVTVDETVSA